jgi:hypothetical protein
MWKMTTTHLRVILNGKFVTASFGQNTPTLPNYIFKSNSTKTNEDTTDLLEKIFLVYWSHEGRKENPNHSSESFA